jgi:mannitol/fructose-specific phosphotransferase system IIA component (Ntr-type)
VLGIVTSGRISLGRITFIVGSTLAFSLLSLTLIRKLADRIISFIKKKLPEQSGITVTFIAILGGICGAITLKIGIHSLFGFFIAGLIAGEARNLSERDRYVFSKMVYALFIPVFFANIGLKIDFISNFDPLLIIFMTVVGVVGRFSAAWLGAVWAKRPRSNRVPIAIAHTPGGEMHLVVGMLALEYGLIDERVFVSIVTSAIFSSVILGPWLGMSIRRRTQVNLRSLVSGMLVFPAIEGRSKEDALHHICRATAKNTGIDDQRLLDLVMERETAMSTAVEEGIAFPHARIEGIKRPLLVYAHSEHGIEWNSPDGKLCRLIFMILTPFGEDDLQVQILGALARVMMQPHNREKLLLERDPGRIKEMLSATLRPQ